MLCVFTIQWAEYQLNGQIVLLENVMFDGMCMYTYLGVLRGLWFGGRRLRYVNQSSCIVLNGGMLSIKETLLGTSHECNNGWVTCESKDWEKKQQMGSALQWHIIKKLLRFDIIISIYYFLKPFKVKKNLTINSSQCVTKSLWELVKQAVFEENGFWLSYYWLFYQAFNGCVCKHITLSR